MKTKIFRYSRLVLLAVIMVNLTACEIQIDGFYDDDSIGDTYYNKSRDLCSRTWVRNFYDNNGNYCRQEIDFYLDRRGVDYIRVQYPSGRISEDEYRFTWNWDNRSQTAMRMVYGPDDISTMKDVQIIGNRLSGYLDDWDNFVSFNGRY